MNLSSTINFATFSDKFTAMMADGVGGGGGLDPFDKESKGVTVKNNGKDVPVYRAGDDFTLKPGEVKFDKETGLVTSEKGVSVNVNPNDLPIKYGKPKIVKYLPDGLKIIPRGKPGHYEIVPEYPMALAEFQLKLNQIITSPIE